MAAASKTLTQDDRLRATWWIGTSIIKLTHENGMLRGVECG